MSKRYNVLKSLNEQIKQGNMYVSSDGNVVSDMYLSDQFMTEFTRGLKLKTIDMKTTPDEYAKKRLAEYTKVVDLMETIEKVLNPAFGTKADAKKELNALYGAPIGYDDTDSVKEPEKKEEKPAEVKKDEKPAEPKTAANAFKTALNQMDEGKKNETPTGKVENKPKPDADKKATK